MTRRSKISLTDTLMRSQRRDVPNASMWSEAPVPPVAEWDGSMVEPEKATPEEEW